MEGWIGEVHSRSNRLKAIDVSVSDEDIIVVLTAGLPSSYAPVIISLDSVKASKLMLDFVITWLLNEESHQVISSEPNVEVKKEEPDNVAMVSACSIQCFYCLEKGHFTSVCPQKAKDVKEWEDKGCRQVTSNAHFASTATDKSDEENYAM